MSDRRIALVTGASKGIGRGIAIGLAEAGWNVMVNYNSDESGASETAESVKAAGGEAWINQANVGCRDQVDEMFAQLQRDCGALHLLVNNAGVQTWSPLLELKDEDWDRVIDTNLKGCFMCTQNAAPMIQAAGGGAIINIGSGANKRPFPCLVDYGASKGGIERLTKVSAVELGPLGIRVNCVAPGAIEIERTKLEAEDYAGTWGPVTPMRRIGNVRDVANAVRFLASSDAEFISGQTLYVDGGLFTQGPWPHKD